MRGLLRWIASVDIILWFGILIVLGLAGNCIASAVDYFDKRACRNTGGLIVGDDGHEWHCARLP